MGQPTVSASSASPGKYDVDPILRYFEYQHLPEFLQKVSQPFHVLAHQLVEDVPRNPERTVSLRKLLESKDAAVRAALPLDS